MFTGCWSTLYSWPSLQNGCRQVRCWKHAFFFAYDQLLPITCNWPLNDRTLNSSLADAREAFINVCVDAIERWKVVKKHSFPPIEWSCTSRAPDSWCCRSLTPSSTSARCSASTSPGCCPPPPLSSYSLCLFSPLSSRQHSGEVSVLSFENADSSYPPQLPPWLEVGRKKRGVDPNEVFASRQRHSDPLPWYVQVNIECPLFKKTLCIVATKQSGRLGDCAH